MPAPDLSISTENLPLKTTVGKGLALKVSVKNIGTRVMIMPTVLARGQCFWTSTEPKLPAKNPLSQPNVLPVPTVEVGVGGQKLYEIHWDSFYDLAIAKKGKYKVSVTVSTKRNEDWVGVGPTLFEKTLTFNLLLEKNGHATLTKASR